MSEETTEPTTETTETSSAQTEPKGALTGAQSTTTQDDSSGQKDWRDLLSDTDLKADPSVQHMNSLDDVVKSYINAQKLVGTDKISVPTKHATDLDWMGVMHKLGLPQDVVDYQFKIPETQFFTDDTKKSLKEAFFKIGVLPRQAEQLAAYYSEQVQGEQESQNTKLEQAIKQGLENLQGEWGQAYDKKMRLANAAFTEFATDEDRDYFDKVGLSNDPVILRFFAKIGEKLGEGALPLGEADPDSRMKAPEEARQEYNKILGDKTHPYWNPQHPNQKAARDEVARLMKMAYPS